MVLLNIPHSRTLPTATPKIKCTCTPPRAKRAEIFMRTLPPHLEHPKKARFFAFLVFPYMYPIVDRTVGPRPAGLLLYMADQGAFVWDGILGS